MARKKLTNFVPEWSFLIDADKISPTPSVYTIHPNPEERKALAVRLGIRALKKLEANLEVVREPGKMTIHVEGRFVADVEQDCVVSGKPVNSRVEDRFEAWYADPGKTVSISKARHEKLLQKGNLEMPLLDESEDPEPLVEGHVDAGELVTQYLSLAINPYPHSEGVVYELGDEEDEAAAPTQRLDNPFAALKDWKDKRNKD
jgi:hypothetical protein